MNPLKTNNAFCVLPFRHMQIRNSGIVGLCCQSHPLTDESGKTFSVYEHSVDEIWNSESMRQIRQDMVEGRRFDGCERCWQREDQGGISSRMKQNTEWRGGSLWNRVWIKVLKYLGRTPNTNYLEKIMTTYLEKIMTTAVKNDFIVKNDPVDLEIEVGNLCNLKCRMCSPIYSSKIESDLVHSKWHDQVSLAGLQGSRQMKADNALESRLPEKKHWFKERSFVYGELLRNPKSIQHISFKGGEPMISKEALGVIEYLNNKGAGKKLSYSITTNATVSNLEIFKAFSKSRVYFAISIDGTDKLFEYIRYPAKWLLVKDNLQRYSKHRNIWLLTSITFQIYNALQIVELFRFCDQFDYRINFSTLHYPSYLAASVMPPEARRVAAKRIRDYVETDCKKQNQSNISSLANGLDAVGNEIDIVNLKKFMLFTNDLDQGRNQRFRDVNEELLGFIEKAGIPWLDETRFFGIQPK